MPLAVYQEHVGDCHGRCILLCNSSLTNARLANCSSGLARLRYLRNYAADNETVVVVMLYVELFVQQHVVSGVMRHVIATLVGKQELQ
jgi:hypothetical protein